MLTAHSDPQSAEHKRELLLRVVLTFAAMLATLSLCLGLPMGGYGALAFVSAIVFHLSLRPSWREMLLTLVPTAVFWASYVLVFKINIHLIPGTVFLLGILGAGSLATLSARVVWSEGAERARVLSVFFPAVGLLVFLAAKQNVINLGALQPGTYDLYLLVADGSLGFYPFLVVRKFSLLHLPFNHFINLIYASLAVAMATVYAAHLRQHKSRYYLLKVFVAAAFLGWLAYNIVPAPGPAYFFGRTFIGPFPAYADLRRLALDKVVMPPDVFRNAMPSLHLTWVLLMYWNARKLSPLIRWFAVIFAFLTAIATLGTGEHYLVDLVVAFPFALLVQTLCSRSPKDSHIRVHGILLGLVLSLTWMLTIRFDPRIFLVSRVLPWTAMLGTVIGAQFVFLRFERAASGVFWTEEQMAAGEDLADSRLVTSQA